MTATAGFLRESEPGYIAHTDLSAPFVTKLHYLDATMFLAETATPAALHMAEATRCLTGPEHRNETAYQQASRTSQTFQSACAQRPKLQRQWAAYVQCAGAIDDGVIELLRHLDWNHLGNACVVDVRCHAPIGCDVISFKLMANAQVNTDSTEIATTLAEIYPNLRLIVQMSERALPTVDTKDLNPRIALQKRKPGAPQTVKDAAVYIARFRSPASSVSYQSLSQSILSELRAHVGILSTNTSATLLLAPCLLPKPGTVAVHVEAAARIRDLSLLQLINEGEMAINELNEIVTGFRDSMGQLTVVNKLQLPNTATVAVGVKYQPYGEGHLEVSQAII
jgi:hypothetical protein